MNQIKTWFTYADKLMCHCSLRILLAHKSVQHYTSAAKLDEGSRIVSLGEGKSGILCFFKALLGPADMRTVSVRHINYEQPLVLPQVMHR